MICSELIIVVHSPEPRSLKFSLKSLHHNLMGWVKSFSCILPTIDTVGSKTIILMTAGTNGRVLEQGRDRQTQEKLQIQGHLILRHPLFHRGSEGLEKSIWSMFNIELGI